MRVNEKTRLWNLLFKSRLHCLLTSDSLCSSQLPLCFGKIADDSAVFKLFFFFSLSSPLPTHLCSAYLVRRNNCKCCWQQSNDVSRGQKLGVGNHGDRQTTKGTGERQEEDWRRGQAGCRQPPEGSQSCGITSHCDDWCPVMTQSQQTAAVWLSTPRSPGLSLVLVLLHAVCLIPPAQPFFRPHSLCSPPVPNHQPHPDPRSCRTERTKPSYCFYKSMINAGGQYLIWGQLKNDEATLYDHRINTLS